jgi:hypothetical protein
MVNPRNMPTNVCDMSHSSLNWNELKGTLSTDTMYRSQTASTRFKSAKNPRLRSGDKLLGTHSTFMRKLDSARLKRSPSPTSLGSSAGPLPIPNIKTKREAYDRFRSLLSRFPVQRTYKRPIWAPWVIASYEISIRISTRKSTSVPEVQTKVRTEDS